MGIVRKYFEKKYGTERGYVRHLLALVLHRLGCLKKYENVDFDRVDRIVFVCLGNICRSAYAHHFFSHEKAEAKIASLGLSTSTGAPANDIASEVAAERGVSLKEHLATDLSDFEVMDGDLFLVMEVKQAKKLGDLLRGRDDVQVALLGSFCDSPHPHLHDPYTLCREYFDHCFMLIENATSNVAKKLSKGRASA